MRDHKVKTSVGIRASDLEWLKQHADDSGRTVSSLINWLIRRYRAEVEQGDRR
jgi:hypothetical protein